MKPPNMAPLYVTMWEVASEIARECGYALAVHGTLGRDLDLLACPWTDAAVAPEALVEALAKRLAWWFTSGERLVVGPERKPHGRLAWSFPYMAEWFIDLSVMPRSGLDSREDSGIGEGAL